LTIVADDATSSAGVATFGHSLGAVKETSFLIWVAMNRATCDVRSVPLAIVSYGQDLVARC
jgi:hypothetical protein